MLCRLERGQVHRSSRLPLESPGRCAAAARPTPEVTPRDCGVRCQWRVRLQQRQRQVGCRSKGPEILWDGQAGGEVGLQNLIDEARKEAIKAKNAVKNGGEAAVEEVASSKASSPEDPTRMPAKEDLFGLPGVVGGFAGGERGLQQYVETGDLKISEPDRRQQFSPLVIALLVAGFGVVGGLLLDDAVGLLEKAVKSSSGLQAGVPGTPEGFTLDPNTKLALQAALALLALTGTGVGIRATVKGVREGTGRLAQQAANFGKVSIFWLAVFVAVKFILENA